MFRLLSNALALVFVICSVNAHGFPTSEGCAHSHNSQVDDLHNLIQPVSVIYQRDEHGKLIEKDTRESLKDLKGPHITEAFKTRARINSGFVVCKSDDPDNPIDSGTGTLYGNGMQLTTALHVTQGTWDKTMPRCWFLNRERPPQKVELDVTPAGMYPFTTLSPAADRGNDLVAIRLKQPIKGANPFPFDPYSSHNGEALLMLSAHHDNQPARLDIRDLIAQFCHSQNVVPRGRSQPLIDSDCTSKGGASGGTLLAYRKGRWANIGSNVGSGSDLDNVGYDILNDVYTQAISYDRQSVTELERFANEQQGAMTK